MRTRSSMQFLPVDVSSCTSHWRLWGFGRMDMENTRCWDWQAKVPWNLWKRYTYFIIFIFRISLPQNVWLLFTFVWVQWMRKYHHGLQHFRKHLNSEAIFCIPPTNLLKILGLVLGKVHSLYFRATSRGSVPGHLLQNSWRTWPFKGCHPTLKQI